MEFYFYQGDNEEPSLYMPSQFDYYSNSYQSQEPHNYCLLLRFIQDLNGYYQSYEVNNKICKMELFLDKNGTNLQRRKMYIGFPVHNMKSHINFDWQNDDPSIQDQMGKRYKHNQQKREIQKKYTQSMNKKLYNRYVELHDDNPQVPKKIAQNDILTKEIENFNNSKIISPNTTLENVSNEMQNRNENRQDYVRPFDSKSNSKDNSPIQSSRMPHNRQSNLQYPSSHSHIKQPSYQLNRSYNPENYYTINPETQRYKSLFNTPNFELGSAPSKFVQKMYTGSAINEYPFRNVKPDELQYHLRERTKADRKKAVKVTLNMFDYYTKG